MQMSQAAPIADVWVKRIKEQVEGLQYGTVQITIHNGQIVQIDRTVRSRYEEARTSSAARKYGSGRGGV